MSACGALRRTSLNLSAAHTTFAVDEFCVRSGVRQQDPRGGRFLHLLAVPQTSTAAEAGLIRARIICRLFETQRGWRRRLARGGVRVDFYRPRIRNRVPRSPLVGVQHDRRG